MTQETKERLARIDEAEQSLVEQYEKLLAINGDLDRTLVSFQANKSESEHRWCKYKEGFSAALVRYVLGRVNINEGCLLDPFAGSGTALFAASEEGLDAVGIELLPSSAEIVAVRKLLMTVDRKHMAAQLRDFAQKRSWKSAGKTEKFQHLRITQGAFPQDTERALERYLYEAGHVADADLQKVLRFAALCVLEVVSYTRKDGQYLRWDSRSGRRAGGKTFDKGLIANFDDAIGKKLEEIAGDIGGEELLFDEWAANEHRGSVNLVVGSCLDALATLKTSSFDIVITSPPYCNRYDYTRTYALELAMMGVGEEAIRDLRQTMLSCTVENKDKEELHKKFGRRIYEAGTSVFESHELLQMILEYLEYCRDAGEINNNGIPRMVRNYFRELALVIFECARVLKPGAPFVMVNDNVRYQGAHIPVDLILSDFAKAAGMEVEKIWVLPRGKGNSSQQMGLHGRLEIRKCVYVWRTKVKQAISRGRKPAHRQSDLQHALSSGNWDHCAPEMREGVTKRELFAALICAGIQANPEGSGSFDAYARDSVKQADALIKALNNTEGSADA